MIKYAAILVVFFSLSGVRSQNLKFVHYNNKNGLSHNSVKHILQDKEGFLWLGTFSGLNRFDGYQFKSNILSTSVDSDIFNAEITDLKLDESSNNLWIGTNKGLLLFNTATYELITFLEDNGKKGTLPYEEIRAVHIDRYKRVWVGTKRDGVHLYVPEMNAFTKIELPDFTYVKQIFEDKDGNIWIGSYNSVSIAKISLGVNGIISRKTNYTLSVPKSDKKNPYIHFIYEDAKSDIFVGTRKGLYKLDPKLDTFTNLYIKNNQLRENLGPYFLSIARAPDGKYWIGTLGGLIVCRQLEDISEGNFERHFSILSDDTSLVDDLVSSLYFDGSGVLWIGTENGLDKYDPYENQFKFNKDISKYIDNTAPTIRGFAKTFDGNLIVATKNNGLFVSKNDIFIPLFDKINNIASIYSEDGRIFYCGLWDGKILVYNYAVGSTEIRDVGFVSSPVLDFLKYNDNTLMVGSFGEGAILLDTETLAPKNNEIVLPFSEINKITRQGNTLWFSTSDGVVNYNITNKVIKLYKVDEKGNSGLPHKYVTDILVDGDTDVWVTTRNGIAKYSPDKDKFERISQPEQLLGKWITDIEIDSSKSLWLNMNNNSLAKYSPVSSEVNVYHIENGNRLDNFSSDGFFKFNDSKIYIGAKDGILYFSPSDIKNISTPPPIITNFKIENKEVLPGVKINGQVPLKKDLNYSKSVVLDYKNRNISFQFSTPSYTNEGMNKFQYRLVGFNEHWIETSSDSRKVQYTNLPSDNYKFELRSRNSDGNWSEASVFDISILPVFWLTWKGFILIALALGLLTYFLQKQIHSRLKLKRELLMEKVKRERDEKLNNEKLRFFTNISHELRTPLTLILGPAKQLLAQDDLGPYSRSRSNLIKQNADRLLRLVNQILDFRRAETGEMALKVSKINILVSTENILNSFLEVAHSKNVSLNLNVAEDSLKCWVDIDKYSKIIFNLLSNALKFTTEYGNVDLFIGFKENEPKKRLVIEVSDDGIGIPVESQKRIFSRFYQVQNKNNKTTGTGIGLSLVKLLVEIHRGEIMVESLPDKGSIFTVVLPVYKGAFSKGELGDFTSSRDKYDTLIPFKKIEASLNEVSVKKSKKNTEVKYKILVIEDNGELRKYVVEYLSEFFKVFEAENGKEGLRICKKVKPTLCVVDVMMPKVDGFEFLRRLKEDDNLSHVPVILLTALAENENRINGYKLGVDSYIVKPFDPSLLKTRIDNILKNHFDLKQKFSGEVESDVMTLAHSQLDIELITKIKDLIEENMDFPELTSSFICKELGLSSSKLYRKITELTDLSPNEFIKTVRLKKSAHLLRTKNYNVSQVANMVGFKDPFYFSKCFKKKFGRSPSTLIK